MTQIIDFGELHSKALGEGLENLTRAIGKRLDMSPTQSGRGSDGGKDLMFVEKIQGPLTAEVRRWLVSCKDKHQSDKSVSESDVGSIVDKLHQHDATGFLLVTTTTPGTALKNKLDKISENSTNKFVTRVWDRTELIEMLLREDMSEVFKSFFPNSYEKYLNLKEKEILIEKLKLMKADEIGDLFENLNLDELRRRLAMRGDVVWPYDEFEASRLDKISRALLIESDFDLAAEISMHLESAVFQRYSETLYKNYPEVALSLCKKTIQSSVSKVADDPIEPKLTAFEFLVANEFPSGQLAYLATFLSPAALLIHYGDEVAFSVMQELDENATSYDMWSDLDTLSSHTLIDEVYVDDIVFEPISGESKICFSGGFFVSVVLQYGNMGDGGSSSDSFPGKFSGYFDQYGLYVERATVDVSKFYSN